MKPDASSPTAARRKPPIRRAPTVPERTLLHALADVLAARPELSEIPNPEQPRPERTTR